MNIITKQSFPHSGVESMKDGMLPITGDIQPGTEWPPSDITIYVYFKYISSLNIQMLPLLLSFHGRMWTPKLF